MHAVHSRHGRNEVRSWGRQPVGAPLVIAHRGASAAAPENTLAAFRRAREEGADGVELDVMRCRSGEVIVFHDDDLGRLGGPGFSTADATRAHELSTLGKIRLGAPAFDERIPTLEAVFEELGPRMLVNVELKAAPTWRERLRDDGLADEVARIVARAGAEARTIVSSFDPLLLLRWRRAARRAGLRVSDALLFAADQARPLREAWAATVLRPGALHPDAALVDGAALRRWRGGDRAVNVWTVDDPAVARALAVLGVDGIITNRPAAIRAALAL
jgi:glycerophosphoryl diester phosphodiesterase